MTVKRKKKDLVTIDTARALLFDAIAQSGLSQSAFARKVGDSQESISMQLHGKRGLSRRVQRRLGLRRVFAYQPAR